MTDTDEQNLIRLDKASLDRPIFRIYPLDRFATILAEGEDAVVNPSKWADPFEDFFLTRTSVRYTTGEVVPLSNLAKDWYGQCWSLNEETDAMWRIYSPDPKIKQGVKVRTTIRKLFQNLKATGSPSPYLHFFIGKVHYLDEAAIGELMSKLTFLDVAMGGRGTRFADLLCMKRTAFAHEAEIRLLYQDIKPNLRGAGGVYRFPLSANAVFEDVVLDPRIDDTEAANLKAQLEGAGCALPINRSRLYESPSYIIPSE